jgi:agmatinase
MSSFNPDDVGISNGNIFGFPVDEENAEIIIIPVPWDATASYGKGTSNGPRAILEASTQLDFYHPQLDNAHSVKVFMTPISQEWQEINERLCVESIEYIQYLEEGNKDLTPFKDFLNRIERTQLALKENLKERSIKLIQENKIVGILGGEHSTPLGLMEALNALYKDFGILQIDAHADLRNAYENFSQSHASIMFNALKNCDNLSKLVQVGIRDIAQSEINLIESSNKRIKTFFDWEIKENKFNGMSWEKQVEIILSELPEFIYVSFDIDGLDPSLCPNTGTPVPGGFQLGEISYLLFKLVDSGRKIIGFDLNEVAPGQSGDWDANVGARALWNLVCATEKSRR